MTQVKSIKPQDAWQLLQDEARAILVDVRSNMEFLFIGHPKGAVNIPWIDEPNWEINPHFEAEVRKLILGGGSGEMIAKGVPVLLICRSGKRSLEAGNLLLKNGLTDIYNIEDGFEGELDKTHHRSTLGGWRFCSLPWEQC